MEKSLNEAYEMLNDAQRILIELQKENAKLKEENMWLKKLMNKMLENKDKKQLELGFC